MTSLHEIVTLSQASASPKREHVLDAAELCFVRSGFHRATMQDIAREAAMSPANIYRYFDSKEAVVLGLAERERERGGAILRELEQSGDRFGTFVGLISRFFTGLTHEQAVLRVEIWAEASRNTSIAELVSRGESEARDWFVGMLAALASSPDCEVEALYERLHLAMKGIIVSRALQRNYDPAPAIAQLRSDIAAGLAGDRPRPARTNGDTAR